MLANACDEWGMPLLAMMYVRGHDVDGNDPSLIRHSARLAAEMGADLVKVPYSGNVESMTRIVT